MPPAVGDGAEHEAAEEGEHGVPVAAAVEADHVAGAHTALPQP